MNNFLEEISARVQACCDSVKQGDDVPPAIAFRLEGAIETGIRHGLATEAEVASLLAGFERVAVLSGDVTRLQFDMDTAPVYPSAARD